MKNYKSWYAGQATKNRHPIPLVPGFCRGNPTIHESPNNQ